MNVMDDVGFKADPVVIPERGRGCDRCGPFCTPYFFAFVNSTRLAFCYHCGGRFKARLEAVATLIIDHRFKLEIAELGVPIKTRETK